MFFLVFCSVLFTVLSFSVLESSKLLFNNLSGPPGTCSYPPRTILPPLLGCLGQPASTPWGGLILSAGIVFGASQALQDAPRPPSWGQILSAGIVFGTSGGPILSAGIVFGTLWS